MVTCFNWASSDFPANPELVGRGNCADWLVSQKELKKRSFSSWFCNVFTIHFHISSFHTMFQFVKVSKLFGAPFIFWILHVDVKVYWISFCHTMKFHIYHHDITKYRFTKKISFRLDVNAWLTTTLADLRLILSQIFG